MCFCNLQVSKTQKVCLINDGVAFYSRLKYLYAAKGGETAIYTYNNPAGFGIIATCTVY